MATRKVSGFLSRLLSGHMPVLLQPKCVDLWCVNPRLCSYAATHAHPHFGLMFDIDGVIKTGQKIVPAAEHAFEKLVDRQHSKFRVPTVFVTNAGNSLPSVKAKQLSDLLEIQVTEEQVCMSYSPLQLYTQFHNKRVLVVGQGQVVDMAKHVGFQEDRIVTVDELTKIFPELDMVDIEKRKLKLTPHEDLRNKFSNIEAVIIFGEPINWETNIQIINDILLTNGHPGEDLHRTSYPYPHVPVVACNPDFVWKAEYGLPRLANGSFLLALETIYKKMTGHTLHYTSILGKPSLTTYLHAERMVNVQAERLGCSTPLRRLYCIGDNPDTDIYGANKFNRFLEYTYHHSCGKKKIAQGGRGENVAFIYQDSGSDYDLLNEVYDLQSGNYAQSCHSYLVCTGVFCCDVEPERSAQNKPKVCHQHRDFEDSDKEQLKCPSYQVQDVHVAVKSIFEMEDFSPT